MEIVRKSHDKFGSPELLRIAGFCLLAAGVCTQSPAAQVSLGEIGVIPNLGTATYQQVLLYNETSNYGGFDCTTASSFALACDAINITDWTVEVDYIDHTKPGDPLVVGNNFGSTIGSQNDPTVAPLYALPYTTTNDCPPCDAIVTKVIFTGNLPNSFLVWNPGDTGPTLFFPQTPFTFTYSPSADYQNGSVPGDAIDFLVNDNPNGGGGSTGPVVPEPATLVLMAGGAMVLGGLRLLRR